jgi:hypothetical protein
MNTPSALERAITRLATERHPLTAEEMAKSLLTPEAAIALHARAIYRLLKEWDTMLRPSITPTNNESPHTERDERTS